jgi:hypothetical protein
VYLNNDFRATKGELPKDSIAIVEHISGYPVFIHVVGKNIWGSILVNGKIEEFPLDDKLIISSQNIVNALGLLLAEIVVKVNSSKQIVLYSISAFPNWSRSNKKYLSGIYDSIIIKLLNDSNTCQL